MTPSHPELKIIGGPNATLPKVAGSIDDLGRPTAMRTMTRWPRRAAWSPMEQKPRKKLESKHHGNFAKAKAHPVKIEEGWDNESDTLHDARFLPGAEAPGHQIWLQARRVWGQDGVDPICNYDLTLVGIAGTISAKGMDALHNPGNEEISVKMFTVTNVINARSGVRAILATGEDRFETLIHGRKCRTSTSCARHSPNSCVQPK